MRVAWPEVPKGAGKVRDTTVESLLRFGDGPRSPQSNLTSGHYPSLCSNSFFSDCRIFIPRSFRAREDMVWKHSSPFYNHRFVNLMGRVFILLSASQKWLFTSTFPWPCPACGHPQPGDGSVLLFARAPKVPYLFITYKTSPTTRERKGRIMTWTRSLEIWGKEQTCFLISKLGNRGDNAEMKYLSYYKVSWNNSVRSAFGNKNCKGIFVNRDIKRRDCSYFAAEMDFTDLLCADYLQRNDCKIMNQMFALPFFSLKLFLQILASEMTQSNVS